MQFPKHIKRYRPFDQHGAAYVLAITTLLVGMTLSIAMLQMGSGYFLTANSRGNKQAVVNLADAGLDYAYWRMHYDNASVPFAKTINLSNGSIRVSAVDDSSVVPSSMLVTSKATCGTHTYTVKRVMSAPPSSLDSPYNYLWCQDADINTSTEINTDSGNRGLRSNGSISLSNFWTSIANGAWAEKTIISFGWISEKHPGARTLNLPHASADYYRSIADEIHPGGYTISNLNLGGSRVIYVSGDCMLDPTPDHSAGVHKSYSGLITIFCEGIITIPSDVMPMDDNSMIAVISKRAIQVINTSDVDMTGVFFCYNGESGYINLQSDSYLSGCFIADRIQTSSNIVVNLSSNPMLDASTLQALHVPGM